MLRALGLLLCFSLSAFGQAPDAPSFSKKIFASEVAAYTVSNVLDGYTTVRDTRWGYSEAPFPQGTAYILGSHPDTLRYVAVMGGIEVIKSFAAYKLEHSHKRVWRLLGHGLMLQEVYAHTTGFVNNLQFNGPR